MFVRVFNPCFLLSPYSQSNTEVQEVRFRHVLGLLQSSACDLVALMSTEASGREGLLTHPGPALLLTGLANCLSVSLGLPTAADLAESNSFGLRLPSKKKPQTESALLKAISGCFAAQTIAATAKTLENLTKSPRFLVRVWPFSYSCTDVSIHPGGLGLHRLLSQPKTLGKKFDFLANTYSQAL